jgi:small subunit ribosomal protein S18
MRRGTKKTAKKRPKRAKSRFSILKKKKCKFCFDKNVKIDHFDHQFMRRFTTERGKIVPARISGACTRHQRKLAKAIKSARNVGLLPFLAE